MQLFSSNKSMNKMNLITLCISLYPDPVSPSPSVSFLLPSISVSTAHSCPCGRRYPRPVRSVSQTETQLHFVPQPLPPFIHTFNCCRASLSQCIFSITLFSCSTCTVELSCGATAAQVLWGHTSSCVTFAAATAIRYRPAAIEVDDALN